MDVKSDAAEKLQNSLITVISKIILREFFLKYFTAMLM